MGMMKGCPPLLLAPVQMFKDDISNGLLFNSMGLLDPETQMYCTVEDILPITIYLIPTYFIQTYASN